LFAYQRRLAEDPTPADFWVTGTVPFGRDAGAHPAWARYESMVNEALGPYAFHALCTYDTRSLPESTIAAAKATHPCLSTGVHRAASPEYQHPADFLADPLAGVPAPPDLRPAMAMTLQRLDHLTHARDLVRRSALSSSAVARESIDDFVTAVNEVLVNALQHGVAPVRLVLWVEPARLTCQVIDDGPGIGNTLAGFRYPDSDGAKGLWVARQLCDDIFVSALPGRGCSVLLFSR
jgi:anti-sigma regulatory factor (Ser/Thr protein kinase)